MKEEKNKWKTIGIVCIILLVIETMFLIFATIYGLDMLEKENECIVNVCRDYDAFAYDEYSKICYCYVDGVEEPEYIKYLGT